MVWKIIGRLGCLTLVLALRADAQTVGPDPDITGALRSLAARASTAFCGEVTSIRHNGSVVEVEFRVEQTVSGAPGRIYTMREWAGLWTGQRRYWVGERALVFLHAPGAGGLSSPVDGMDGVLPLRGAASAGGPSASVERLRTRVERGLGDPLPPGGATMSVADIRTAIFAEANPRPVRPRPAHPAGEAGSGAKSSSGALQPMRERRLNLESNLGLP